MALYAANRVVRWCPAFLSHSWRHFTQLRQHTHTHTRKTILQCARDCTGNYNLNSSTLSMYIQLVIATIKSSCVVTGCE